MNKFYQSYVKNNCKIRKIFGFKIKTPLPSPPPIISKYLLNIAPYINLPRLEIHIADHCNLNCQSCTHFSPLASKEFMPLEVFEKDLKRIKELTQKIGFINILGGEPLLNPDCTKYLEIARNYFPQTTINLVTNGILLSSQDKSFFECLHKNNITLRPTKYPIKINWNKIKKTCAKYSVNLQFYNNEKVLKTSHKMPLDLKGKQDERRSFLKCIEGCVQLYKGKIYKCPFAAYIDYFNKHFKQNLEVCERDYIDIYKVQDIQEILDFLIRPIPFCRYCDSKNLVLDFEWKVSSEKIEEWIDCEEF